MPARPQLPPPTRTFPEAHLVRLPGRAAEDVVVGHDGYLYCGLEGGAIVRIDPTTERCTVVATTGGRPLGLEATPEGLLICDAELGLLRLDFDSGTLDTLADSVQGIGLRFCSNAVVSPDGSVWFTQSSTRFGFAHYQAAFIEHNPSGRLLRWDMSTRAVEVVLSNLDFPNGLALTPSADALLLVETGGYRVSRIELDTQFRFVSHKPLLTNLPGFPDNLSSFGPDGYAWLAFTNPRSMTIDQAGRIPAWARKAIWRLPDALLQGPRATVWVRAITSGGEVVEDLRTTRRDFEMSTGAAEVGGKLYVAGLANHSLLCVEL